MTKSVDKRKWRNYLIKAENSLDITKYALAQKKYDGAVSNAVHSAINALDALTVNQKGTRASGEHDEILLLIKGIFTPKDYGDIEKQFSSLVDLKNTAEYQPDFIKPEEGRNSIKWAERILTKVKAKLQS
jgi:uncharacterized protein (UPF0332 family)